MQGPGAGGQGRPEGSELHFRDQLDDGAETRDDTTTLAHDGELVVARDEEPGGDPYNHTGSFRRSVR